MTIMVEDGTGVQGAESYASVAFADAYFTARSHLAIATTWAAVGTTTAKKEGALREATAYLDAEFGPRYRGTRAGRVQGLLWPRTGALGDEGYSLPALPLELQQAAAELAGRAISAPLADDEARGGDIKRMKAGSVEIEYAQGAKLGTTYGIVSKMLIPLLDCAEDSKTLWSWR
jgi:hypothetical protein